MIRRFCDRDGRLVTTEAFAIVWTDANGVAKTSDLCKVCHDDLVTWFGRGNPDPEAVIVAAKELQSATVLVDALPVVGVRTNG